MEAKSTRINSLGYRKPVIDDCVCEIYDALKPKFTCQTTHVVYKYACIGCGEEYIGRTSNRIVDRHTQHKNDVKKKEIVKNALSDHIEKGEHDNYEFSLSIISKHRDTVDTVIAEARTIESEKPTLNRKNECERWI